MSLLIGAVLFWLFCGVIAAGIFFADVQGGFPSIAKEYYREDLGLSVGVGLIAGPFALVVALFMSGFCQHGWRLR